MFRNTTPVAHSGLQDFDVNQSWPFTGQICDTGIACHYYHPMPNGSLSLTEYPAAMLRLKCWKCGRSGQYRKAALIEKYGAGVPLPDLLHKIASDCPKMDALGNDPCGAHYRDV